MVCDMCDPDRKYRNAGDEYERIKMTTPPDFETEGITWIDTKCEYCDQKMSEPRYKYFNRNQ